jgi:hypothetical protein
MRICRASRGPRSRRTDRCPRARRPPHRVEGAAMGGSAGAAEGSHLDPAGNTRDGPLLRHRDGRARRHRRHNARRETPLRGRNTSGIHGRTTTGLTSPRSTACRCALPATSGVCDRRAHRRASGRRVRATRDRANAFGDPGRTALSRDRGTIVPGDSSDKQLYGGVIPH